MAAGYNQKQKMLVLLKLFYEEAMKKLEKVFSAMSSVDLSKAGEDLLDQVEDKYPGVLDKAQAKLGEVKDKLKDIDLAEKLDEIDEKLKGINLAEKLDNSGLKDAVEGVKSTIDALKDKESDVRKSVQSVTEAFKDLFSGK